MPRRCRSVSPFLGPALPLDWSRCVLERAVMHLRQTTGYAPRVGAELEFYVRGASRRRSRGFLDASRSRLEAFGLRTVGLTQEIAESQYEISLEHGEPLGLVGRISVAMAAITQTAADLDLCIDLRPRPFRGLPGSGMHLHLSLHDSSGENVFMSRTEEGMSSELASAIAGLLCFLPESMIFFSPRASSYERYRDAFSRGCFRFSNAPATVSWGGDNRTVALRLPGCGSEPGRRRIEHRVPCSDADPSLAIGVMLLATAHGLTNRLPLTTPKTVGDANYSDCTLQRLPLTLTDSIDVFCRGVGLRCLLSNL